MLRASRTLALEQLFHARLVGLEQENLPPLGGQFFEHVTLQAPEQTRCAHRLLKLVKMRGAGKVPTVLTFVRRAVALGEREEIVPLLRGQGMKQRPELDGLVGQGRPGEEQLARRAMREAGFHRARFAVFVAQDRARAFGVRILEKVRLVRDEQVPLAGHGGLAKAVNGILVAEDRDLLALLQGWRYGAD